MENHLKKVYGFNNFREYQKEIIEDLLGNNNVFVVLPTGGGKSLLYQFPATFTNKISVVISPLLSLMNDQCMNLSQKGVKCICLNSESKMNTSLISSRNKLENNSIIFTTPEYITTNMSVFKRMEKHIGLFAVDEAHCVSQWSHDFRNSYQQLNILKEHFTKIPLLAVTATATPKVLEEMYEILNIKDAVEYCIGTRRTNLYIEIKQKTNNIIQDIIQDLDNTASTIIYVQTRKECHKIKQTFNKNNIECLIYHGGMSLQDKTNNHKKFMSGEIKLIVATISFGMGIDKSDIRHVINYGVPTDLETYCQEIGRAGRDGMNSKATLFYKESDFGTALFLISKSNQQEYKLKLLDIFRKYLSEMNMCRQQIIEYYFSNGTYSTEADVSDIPKCMMCDNCLRKENDKYDISQDSINIVNLVKSLAYNIGIQKLILILKGSNSVKIQNEHTNYYHGVLSNKDEKYCRDVIDILITKNILKRYVFGKNYTIGLGIKNINDNLPITTYMNQPKNINKTYDTIREMLAYKYNVLPSMIVNDKVLLKITKIKPKTLEELWLIDGVSQQFVVNYGNYFIIPSHRDTPRDTKIETADISFQEYNSGKSIEEISIQRNLKPLTIENHLIQKWKHSIDKIDLERLHLTKNIQEEIKQAIRIVGVDKLRPIKDIVNPKISYLQIRVTILILQKNNL